MITEVQADDALVTGRGWRALFDDRYGDGSAERLKSMLEQPCITFARIAAEFGVTRECVRLWHQRLLPDAPRGHQRQQLCREHQMKRRLLEDALFLRFYRRIRSSVPQQRVTLIPSRDGFRKRTVRIDGRTIALRRARRASRSSDRQGLHACERWAWRGFPLLRALGRRVFARAARVPACGTGDVRRYRGIDVPTVQEHCGCSRSSVAAKWN